MATAGGERGAGAERAWAPELGGDEGTEVLLDREESGHLVRSRRVRAGDAVVLFDGAGTLRDGTLVGDDPKAARVLLGGAHPARDPGRTLRLAIALPEMGRCDRMLAMLAELGVAEVAPLTCARADPGRPAQAVKRAGRWAKLAREALKVNGASRALVVGPARPIDNLVSDGAVLLDPDPSAAPLAAVLEGVCPTPWLVIGPEGGFTAAETSAARAAGAPIARLGAPALRVETAAVAAAAVALS